MKKQSLLFMAVILLFVSCSKKDIDTSTPQTQFMQTTTQNLKPTPTTVTLSSAIELATGFLQSKNPNLIVSIKSAETVVKNGMPYMHIINANNNAGYAMIAADSVYEPILAYDRKSNFDKTNINLGLAMWFNKHGHELDFVRNTKTPYTDSIGKANKKLWVDAGKKYTHTNTGAAPNPQDPLMGVMGTTTTTTYEYLDKTVGPLCNTEWSQDYPFNQFCPTGTYSSGHMPAGCVPVAMAQIMYFWHWPNTYNWSSMVAKIDPSNSTTWPVNNAAGFTESAKLIHDIGTTDVHKVLGFPSQLVDYSDAGTSANDVYCPNAFSNFGYLPAARTESVSDQSLWGRKNGTSYSGLLADEILINQRPCLVSGFSGIAYGVPWYVSPLGALIVETPNGDGHTWVCDGCEQHTTTVVNTTTEDGNGQSGEQTDPTNPDEPYVHVTRTVFNQGYLHMNWGWRGKGQNNQTLSNDGWYNYSINYTQANTGRSDFQYFQTIVYNIYY